jgi:hypothetical protein
MISFPAQALLIVEERLKEQEAEGVQMPDGMPLDELAPRVLIAAELARGR